MDRNPDFAGILGETFSLFGDAIRYVAIYALTVGGLGAIGVLFGLIEPTGQFMKAGASVVVDGNSTAATVLFQLGVAIVSIVASYFLLSKLLETRGHLSQGGTRIWAYVGLTILWALGLLVGFVLLVIPGLMLLVRWSASTGFLIGAREGIVESLGRSWDATSGYSWPIFFSGLVMILIAGVASSIVNGIAFSSGVPAVGGAIGVIVESLGTALSYCFGISVYCLLGGRDHLVSEVFE